VLQTRTPMTLYPAISLGTNLITSAHHIPFVAAVLFIFPPELSPEMLLAVPGFVLALILALGVGIALSIWCAYVPDLAELIAVGQRFLMFFTPIMWMPSQRPKLEPFLLGNPFYHMVNVVRGPIVGTEHLAISFGVMGGMCIFVWVMASVIYWRAAGAVATRL
jgi:ABC-type polysaccharide/polyol phosphate export permease